MSPISSWLGKPQGLFDPGNLQKSMGTAGGRPEIGPYPKWHVLWLYTGDERMREVALGNTDLSAAWPIHLREGDPTKFLDRDGQVPGVGHVMSVSTRPTLALGNGYSYAYTLPADKVVPVGPTTDGGWKADLAHQGDFWSVAYALTGDFWYLEEGWFWSAWSVARLNGAAYALSYGRGPTGAEGGLQGEIRGQAWTLRSRVNMHFISPDDAPEKALLQTWVHDAVAIQEGAWNIKGTQFEGNANWLWGRNLLSTNSKETLNSHYPPLYQFRKGSTSLSQSGYGIDTAVTLQAESNFEQHFMLLAIGRAAELGHPTNAVLARFAKHYVGVLTEPDYNPYLLANGRVPTVRKSDGKYFSTWADLKQGYQSSWQTATTFPLGDAEHGYDFLGLAAVSMIRDEPGGTAAWDFVEQEILPAPVLDTNPKWALVPRSTAALSVDLVEISLAAGGTQTYSLDAGPGNALGLYLLLTTTAGTSPGTPIPQSPLTLPLNSSSLLIFTAALPGLLIPDSLDYLDSNGQRTLALTLPGGLDPGLAGVSLHSAYVLLDVVTLAVTFVSNAVELGLVP